MFSLDQVPGRNSRKASEALLLFRWPHYSFPVSLPPLSPGSQPLLQPSSWWMCLLKSLPVPRAYRLHLSAGLFVLVTSLALSDYHCGVFTLHFPKITSSSLSSTAMSFLLGFLLMMLVFVSHALLFVCSSVMVIRNQTETRTYVLLFHKKKENTVHNTINVVRTP